MKILRSWCCWALSFRWFQRPPRRILWKVARFFVKVASRGLYLPLKWGNLSIRDLAVSWFQNCGFWLLTNPQTFRASILPLLIDDPFGKLYDSLMRRRQGHWNRTRLLVRSYRLILAFIFWFLCSWFDLESAPRWYRSSLESSFRVWFDLVREIENGEELNPL